MAEDDETSIRGLNPASLMGQTRRVIDRRTGEVVVLTTYVRNGRTVTARLPPHLFREGLTPRRLEAMADFAEVATKAYGQRRTGALSPAAEVVQRELRRRRTGRGDTEDR